MAVIFTFGIIMGLVGFILGPLGAAAGFIVGMMIGAVLNLFLEPLSKIGAPKFIVCPFCKSDIPESATVCRYCQRDIPPEHQSRDIDQQEYPEIKPLDESLLAACFDGNVGEVEELLNSGANPDATTNSGFSARSVAEHSENADLINLFNNVDEPS